MRVHNWEKILDKMVIDSVDKRWSPGSYDCAAFASDWVKRVTGRDPFGEFRNSYSTLREMKEIIDSYGSLVEVVSKCAEDAGFEEIPVNFAQRGDVVILEKDGEQTIAVISLSGTTAIYPEIGIRTGLAELPIEYIIKSWRIE